MKNILKTIVTVSGKDDKECVNQFISVPQWDQCADRVPRVFSGPSDNRSKLIKKDTFPFVQFNHDLWIVRTVQSNFAAQIWNLIQIFKMKLLFQRICAPPHSPININVHGRRGKKVRDCEFLYVYSWKFQCRNWYWSRMLHFREKKVRKATLEQKAIKENLANVLYRLDSANSFHFS